MSYTPHTPKDIEEMLKTIGETNTDALFDEIPETLLRSDGLSNIPHRINAMNMLKEAQKLALRSSNGVCFMGAGAYEHHIPAAVWEIASRGEFLTAYTPYQAEASQGTLQLLYEFQTMIAELTGMDLANASLYDGASALAEAILMAVRLKREEGTARVLVPMTLHPFYRETIETIVKIQNIELIFLPFSETTGTTLLSALKPYEGTGITALVIVQPNFFGCLESVDELADWAKQEGAISIASVNPTSLALLTPPGEWGQYGVDIVTGEGQPLGIPLASGGPYFGFLSTRMAHVRQVPGRLIGRTVDLDGKEGFTLTLQAREQHIRRARATSNICTNQGLLVTLGTIYLSLLGPQGLNAVAKQSHLNTVKLKEALCAIPGVKPVFSSPFFHEVLLKLPVSVDTLLIKLERAGIQGGYAVSSHYPELSNTLLVSATEVRTDEEIHRYSTLLKQLLVEKDVACLS